MNNNFLVCLDCANTTSGVCSAHMIGNSTLTVGRVTPIIGRTEPIRDSGFVLPQDGHIARLQQENARLKAAARALCERLRKDSERNRVLGFRKGWEWKNELAALERELEGRE